MMRGGHLVTWMLCGSILALPAVTIAERVECQRSIARESARFRETISKALQSCEDGKLRGKLQAAADCRADPATVATRQAAVDTLRSRIAKDCGGRNKTCNANDVGPDADDALSAIGWGIPQCPGPEDGACRNPLTTCDDIAT